jgi:hypothetical protein
MSLLRLCLFVLLFGCINCSFAGGFQDSEKDSSKSADLSEVSIEQRILGKTFYAYFPRKDCADSLAFRSKPSDADRNLYKADSVQSFVVVSLDHPFYAVKMEDGNIAYINRYRLRNYLIEGYLKEWKPSYESTNLDSEYVLREKCVSKYSPIELQAKLDVFEAKAKDVKFQRAAEAPSKLKEMSKEEFCEFYGNVLRDKHDALYDLGERPDAVALVKTEARRRKLSFSDILVRKEQISVGNSICQLNAQWGIASQQNRSAGSWGVDIQHVYGGTYVYTRNGVVTSWQD